MKSRIAVLASGGGSNLHALLDYLDQLGERRSGDVAVVASDRSAAGALEHAVRRGIPTSVLATTAHPEREQLMTVLERHAVDLVVLAGYLRLIPPEVVERYRSRIINVHPALLPAFGGPGMYGARVHQAVIDAGVRVTGVTVHFVDAEYDHGPIIAQWPVPVFPGDDAGTVAARVLRVEHLLLPRVVDAVAGGRIAAGAPAVPRLGHPVVDARPAFTLLSHEESRVAENIELALGL